MQFATYIEAAEQLQHVALLAESIRTFGGRFGTAAILVYSTDDLAATVSASLRTLGATVVSCCAPMAARSWPYAGKVYAAAGAEASAEGATDVLVWMDEDTIVLDEPKEFELADSVTFAYRPVMHNRSGSLNSEPPDAFWSRIYEVLEISETALFPMTTPADRQVIRAHFNAGLLVVRPERQILRRWAQSFETLYGDGPLAAICGADRTRAIFLHQTALVGAVLNTVERREMIELPDTYNYPIFFDHQYESARAFGSIQGVFTLRHDTYFRDPHPEWANKLSGPADKISWLRSRLASIH